MKASLVIADDIRRRIARGELQAGEALPVEAELTEQVGVSKGVLREALRILETEGLVEVRRGLGGGPTVRHPSISKAADAMGVYLQIGDVLVMDVFEARDRIIADAVERLATSRRADDADCLELSVRALQGVVGEFDTYYPKLLDVGETAVRLAGNVTEHVLVVALRHIIAAELEAATRSVVDFELAVAVEEAVTDVVGRCQPRGARTAAPGGATCVLFASRADPLRLGQHVGGDHRRRRLSASLAAILTEGVTVKFMLEYPILTDVEDGAWTKPANIAEFARVAEAAGVDGLAFTDHPAPSKKWLTSGGHATFDPFVALGFVAGVTSTIRLMTYLTVLPYRTPLLTAKSMTAVDVLSEGRTTFVLGTGYLRSEFSALGVDFEERNALFDEAVEVMRGVWSTDDFRYEGRHFTARGVTMVPGPVQQPHPPLWLGGNAQVVRDRVAAWGAGWGPLLGGPGLTQTTRTSAIEDDAALAAMIAEIKEKMAANGRDPASLDVSSGSVTPLAADAGTDEKLDAIARLGEMGVTWTFAAFQRSSFGAALDSLREYGEEIIAKAH